MPGKSLKEKARTLLIDAHTRYALLQKLVLDGFFDSPVSSEDVIRRIKEKFGKRWETSYVQTYMRKFMEAGVIHAVKLAGHKGNYWVLASMKREQALKVIGTAAETNGNLACRETTLGDLAVAAHLSSLDYFGEVPWSEFAAANEWYVRMKSRPAFRSILLDRVPGQPPVSHYAELDF